MPTTTTKKKTKKQLAREKMRREIARRNKAFAAAATAEKRVLIAKDVLAQIKAKRFAAAHGVWVDAANKPLSAAPGYIHIAAPIDDKFSETDSVRELFIAGDIQRCRCCALGALFMSCTLYNNKTTVEDFVEEISWDFGEIVDNGQFKNQLTSFFSRAQLKLIESVFESENGVFDVGTDDRKRDLVDAWSHKFRQPEDRLVAIMQNIIRNKGTFVLKDL
jgi:hypothetical protein